MLCGGRPSCRPSSRSSSVAGAFASSARTAAIWSVGRAMGRGGDREVGVRRSSRARTSGSAWIGFEEERMKQTSSGRRRPRRSCRRAPRRHARGGAPRRSRCGAPRRRSAGHGGEPYATCERAVYPVCSGYAAHDGHDYDARPRRSSSPHPSSSRRWPTRSAPQIIALLRERAHSTRSSPRSSAIPKGTVGHHLKVLETRRPHPASCARARCAPSRRSSTAGRRGSSSTRPRTPRTRARSRVVTLRQAASEVERAPDGAGSDSSEAR